MSVFGVRALKYLRAQEPFIDSQGKRRRIDFVLEGEKRYALEIEGASYHAAGTIGRERFEDDKRRQAELAAHGYTYLPFSMASLGSGFAEAMLGDLAIDDKVLWRLLRARQAAGEREGQRHASYEELEALLKRFPERYQGYQKLALALVREAVEKGQAHLEVADASPRLPLLSLAFLDTVALLENVMELYGHAVTLPEVSVHLLGERSEVHDRLLERYLGCPFQEGDKRVDASRTKVRLLASAHLPRGAELAFCSKAETPRPDAPIAALDYPAFERRYAPFLDKVGASLPLELSPASFERPVLDYFARRYFPYAELQHEQLLLVQRALRQESGLGILPTGFGKSAIFQLFAILMPRTTLVISPLKALMRDQVHALKRRGWVAADAISSSDTAAEKTLKLKNFSRHKYRLLYLSPERLQIKSFRDELQAAIAKTPVGALVVDEAHCVSEWGHDFRPAYLQVGPVREALEAASGRQVPILGLTATASPTVREDIVAMLGLPEESVVQLSSSDRPNLSLSVHPVRRSEDKDPLMVRLLKEDIPRALKLPFDELLPIGDEPPFKHAGVVFSIYANPHGRSSLGEGVHGVAEHLQEQVIRDSSMVQVHASSEPTVCPECDSPLYISANKRMLAEAGYDPNDANLRYYCTKNGHFFAKPKRVSGWDAQILERQDAFQDDQFPVLVATKGFGMGIDKRNIRFIVHHALAGGFEGYYQEAGRAGRDKKHAHVALAYKPPVAECFEKHLRHTEAPPCVTSPADRKFHRCPFDKNGLCDYGRQAHFIANSYPGAEADEAAMLSAFEELSQQGTLVAQGDDEIKAKQLALYRLQQLGVITSYSLAYESLWRVAIEAERAAFSRESVAEHLKRFLIKSKMSPELASEAVETLSRPRAEPEKPKHYGLVKKAAGILLERVYQVIPRMRYEMLNNQLEYATSHEQGVCRRHFIRSIFDSDNVALEGYQCGFCDVCAPGLEFERSQAEVPTRDAQVEDLVRKLPDALRGFDVEELPLIARVASEKNASRGLYYRMSNTLEHDGTNVAARYLAGALGKHHPELREQSLGHLRAGYQELARQGQPDDALVLAYREAATIDKDEAFAWVDEQGGRFDSAEGLSFLWGESKRLFGPQSETSRNLASLRSVREVAGISDDVGQLAGAVQALGKLLDEMPQLER